MNLVDKLEWQCPKEGCDAQLWEHELWGMINCDNDDELMCPLPPEPRECCGVVRDVKTDVERTCENGCCVGWYCPCGRYTGASAGPVMCGCEYDRDDAPEEVG